jgi:AraC-like DNA-binding protein
MQLFLSLSGIVLSAILLYFNARENKSVFYLGGFFLLAGLYSLSMYTLLNSESITLTAVVLVNSSILPYLIGPLLYFYIRSVLKDDPALTKSDLWHLLPVFLFLVVVSPYLFSSWTNKTPIAGKLIIDLKNQEFFDTAFLGNKLSAYFAFIVPAILTLYYVLWSTRLLFSFLKDKKQKQVFISQQPTIQWIKAFLTIEIILAAGYTLFMIKVFGFGDLRRFASLNTLEHLLGIGPIAILILTFFSPAVLYGLPRIPGKRGETIISQETPEPVTPNEKPNQIQLELGYLQTIGREADSCMEKFQPYTNPTFNLTEFSVLLRIPVHHLSFYFREEKKQSFSEYRNEWRVNHAKKLILEGKTGEMTLEAIGMLSGFPNRDSFRAAFQRIEGVTPAVFITRREG